MDAAAAEVGDGVLAPWVVRGDDGLIRLFAEGEVDDSLSGFLRGQVEVVLAEGHGLGGDGEGAPDVGTHVGLEVGGVGDGGDEEARPVEARAVGPLGAGFEKEGGVVGFLDGTCAVFHLGGVVVLEPFGDVVGEEVVGEAGGVGEEVAELDLLGGFTEFGGAVGVPAFKDVGVGELGQDFANRGVEGDLAGFDELESREGGEEFGAGCYPEDGVRGEGFGFVGFERGGAEGFVVCEI